MPRHCLLSHNCFHRLSGKGILLITMRFSIPNCKPLNCLLPCFTNLGNGDKYSFLPARRRTHRAFSNNVNNESSPGRKVFSTTQGNERKFCYQIRHALLHWTVTKKRDNPYLYDFTPTSQSSLALKRNSLLKNQEVLCQGVGGAQYNCPGNHLVHQEFFFNVNKTTTLTRAKSKV